MQLSKCKIVGFVKATEYKSIDGTRYIYKCAIKIFLKKRIKLRVPIAKQKLLSDGINYINLN
jgi:hypothetical protein